MKSRILIFTAPKRLELHEAPLPPLKKNDVLVETVCSAISAGTEMLVYRGEFPSLTDTHDPLSSNLNYPLPYGYACVGLIRETGQDVDKNLRDKLVFGFHPHASHFIAPASSLLLAPASLSAEACCFLPNMETAVNLIQDGAPLLGERALVLGQGVVGLLAASLLREFPLETLVTADRYPLRRQASLAIGVDASLDPAAFNPPAEDDLAAGSSLAETEKRLAPRASSPASFDSPSHAPQPDAPQPAPLGRDALQPAPPSRPDAPQPAPPSRPDAPQPAPSGRDAIRSLISQPDTSQQPLHGYTQNFDLTFELSGSPSALNLALSLTAFSGRIIVGSWYGRKKASIDLGGAFHRSRIQLIASQVSTIAPALSGRWDKARRFKVAWEALKRIQPQKWITHRFPITEAQKAYHLLDEHPHETIQVIFEYE
jgi:threonine dehydrogenase-like Zn-dependent dehydrogenase